MSVFRQPWVLVFVLLLGGYTYKVLNNAGNVSLTASSAQASGGVIEDASKKPLKVVQLKTALKSQSLNGLEIKAFETMDVNIVKGMSPEIQLQLSGEGRRYGGNGGQFENWLHVELSDAGVLKVEPALKSGVQGKLVDFWSNSDRLKLLVLVPHTMGRINALDIKTVSGNVLVSGLTFKSVEVSLVSGDINLASGAGESLSIQSVSGDIVSEAFQFQSGQIKSVSGDVSIRSDQPQPNITVQTVSGDMDLSVPQSSRATVSFESISGELDSALVRNKQGKGQVQFSSLSGDAKISKIK